MKCTYTIGAIFRRLVGDIVPLPIFTYLIWLFMPLSRIMSPTAQMQTGLKSNEVKLHHHEEMKTITTATVQLQSSLTAVQCNSAHRLIRHSAHRWLQLLTMVSSRIKSWFAVKSSLALIDYLEASSWQLSFHQLSLFTPRNAVSRKISMYIAEWLGRPLT